jgi:hypothetical protein
MGADERGEQVLPRQREHAVALLRLMRVRLRATTEKGLKGVFLTMHQTYVGPFSEVPCPAKRASVSVGGDATHRRGVAEGGCGLARKSANGPPSAGEALRRQPLPWLRVAPKQSRTSSFSANGIASS